MSFFRLRFLFCLNLLAFSFLWATACAPLFEKKSTRASHQIVTTDKTAALDAYNNTEVYCGMDNQGCPGFVGGLVTISIQSKTQTEISYGIEACSMQLIDHNKVLTNLHCLPHEISFAEANCKDKIRFFFPQTNSDVSEQFECSKVLQVAKNKYGKIDAPDWAIIELAKSSSRKPLSTNPKGLKTGAALSLYPVYYSNQLMKPGFIGRIQKTTCKSTMLHPLHPYYFHKESPLVTAAICDKGLIPGNSGAGIFDNENNLVAVGSFGFKRKTAKIKAFGLSRDVENNMTAGTNLHCIPYFNTEPSRFCKFPFTNSFSKKSEELMLINSHIQSKNFEHMKLHPSQYISSESKIRWIVSTEKSQNYKSQAIPSIFEDGSAEANLDELIAQRRLELTTIYKPECIKEGSQETIQVFIPYVPMNQKNLALTENGLLKKTIQKERLPMELKKEGHIYKGQIDNLTAPQAPALSPEERFLNDHGLQSFGLEIPTCNES